MFWQSKTPPWSRTGDNEKEGVMDCFLDPCAAPRAPARFPLSVDCCLSVFRSFFTRRGGGGSFLRPGAATAQKFGSQPQGVTSMTPSRPPAALTRRLPQVDCCLLFFCVFHYPREGGGGLRPSSAAATPTLLRGPFRWPLPPVATPGGYAQRLPPTGSRRDARTRSLGPLGAVGGPAT